MRTRLYNARILTMEENRNIFNGEIWIEDEKIIWVAEQEEVKYNYSRDMTKEQNWDVEIDCCENLLMPGFKNAHTHSGMTLLRSMADDMPLEEWLHEQVFPVEAQLQEDDIFHFAKIAILEYLTSGITAIFDMYLKPEQVAQACMTMGMRCVLTSGFNDFTSSVEQMESEFLKWNTKNSLLSYQLGFHAEYTCNPQNLKAVSALAHKYAAPVFTHMAETETEVKNCIEKYNTTPAVYLDSIGMFDFGGGAYHGVHMTAEDMNVLAKNHMFVITNPGSNTKLASGIAPIAEYLERNIPVAIGTDGPASNNCLDMFREMFLVTGLSKLREKDSSSVNAIEVLKMATVNGAKALGLTRSDVLAKKKLADIIMIDLHQPNMQPINNIEKNIVYSGSKLNVKMTMIHGKILYQDGKFNVGETPEQIYKKCEEIKKRILDAY